MNTDRVNELVQEMTSFSKEKYHKSEMLEELFKLQAEMVRLTFNDQHASLGDLKIYDVERHLQALNEEMGHVADAELEKYMNECKLVCNMIRAEISGNKGEYKAFKNLEYLRRKHIILKNVELSEGKLRTELDAIVITSAGITIVEVKNTAKDIHIDAKGNYYSTGEFLRLDCNIAEKMSVKEKLLAGAISLVGGDEVKIQSVVVFTNPHIEVHNECGQVKTCFVSTLNRMIDDFRSGQYLSDDKMLQISAAIESAASKECYPPDFDVIQFKTDFATVMAILEEASTKKEGRADVDAEEKMLEDVVTECRLDDLRDKMQDKDYDRHTLTEDDFERISKHRTFGYLKHVAAAAAVFGLGLLAGQIIRR